MWGPKDRRYYSCKACGKGHRLDHVDAVVVEKLRAFLSDPNIQEEAAGTLPDPPSSGGGAVAEIEKELADLDLQEERLARLLRKQLIQASTGEKQLQEVVTLRADAQNRLRDAKEAVARHVAFADRLTRLDELRQMVQRHVQRNSFEAWRELVLKLPIAVKIQLDGEVMLTVRDDYKYRPVSGSR